MKNMLGISLKREIPSRFLIHTPMAWNVITYFFYYMCIVQSSFYTINPLL